MTPRRPEIQPGAAPAGVVQRPFRSAFVDYARRHEEVVCLSADLTSSCEADGFKETFPDRFYSVGMTEQSMLGVAGGMAREGLVPFVTTFSVFVTRRPYDQLAMAVAYPNLPVRLMGFLPGITTPGGVTHQAVDDVGLMRCLPNMTVLDLGDATEVETVFSLLDSVEGPAFCRVLRGEVPRLFDTPIRLGVTRQLSEGTAAVLVTSGVATDYARAAVAFLASMGIGVRHLHVSTLKPFGDELLLDALADAGSGVVTCENHSILGGLASATCELLATHGIAARVVRLGVQDRFTHGGSTPYLARYYGLDAVAVVRAVTELVGCRLASSDSELSLATEVARAELDATLAPCASPRLGRATANVEAL